MMSKERDKWEGKKTAMFRNKENKRTGACGYNLSFVLWS